MHPHSPSTWINCHCYKNEVHINYLGKMLPLQFRHGKAWQVITWLYLSGKNTSETTYSNADGVHMITNAFTSTYSGFCGSFCFSTLPPIHSCLTDLERCTYKVYFKRSMHKYDSETSVVNSLVLIWLSAFGHSWLQTTNSMLYHRASSKRFWHWPICANHSRIYS